MSLPSIGLSMGGVPVQDRGSVVSIEIAVPIGPTSIGIDLPAPPPGRFWASGVWPDLNAGSTVTLTINSPDGAGSVIARASDDYPLGGIAQFEVTLS